MSRSNWNFSGNVPKNFDDHINRSIPLYNEVHLLFSILSDFFIQKNSKIIDLGCSTGTFLNLLYKRHKSIKKKLKYIGINIIKPMILLAKKKNKKNKINFINGDIFNFNLNNACIISSFYTIQFIPKKNVKF